MFWLYRLHVTLVLKRIALFPVVPEEYVTEVVWLYAERIVKGIENGMY